jgi:hypothetical protein
MVYLLRVSSKKLRQRFSFPPRQSFPAEQSLVSSINHKALYAISSSPLFLPSFLLGSNIFLSTVLTNCLSRCSVRDSKFYTYETGKQSILERMAKIIPQIYSALNFFMHAVLFVTNAQKYMNYDATFSNDCLSI